MHKFLFIMCLMLSEKSFALEYFEGNVVSLEATYLPGLVAFYMDAGNSTCPAGKQLKWSNSDAENNKLVYSTLLTALVSGKRVRFYIKNNDGNCFGEHLYLIK